MLRYDFHTRDEDVRTIDCARVFFVPGDSGSKPCQGETIYRDNFGARSIECEYNDCPLILGRLALQDEEHGGF